MKKYRFLKNGDKAITMELGNVIDEKINRRVTAVCNAILQQNVAGIVDVIPTFRSVTICYEPEKIRTWKVRWLLNRTYRKCGKEQEEHKRIVCIPVCYGGEYGPDLSDVAAFHGLSEQEVIEAHSGRDYLIYMLGFLPGFPYLGGMDERLVTPRLDSPRVRIEPGSVGIGGQQTGIYPMASPGGWRLIGRTPVTLYDPQREDSVPYEAGDYIRFVSISEGEYEQILAAVNNGTYKIAIEESR